MTTTRFKLLWKNGWLEREYAVKGKSIDAIADCLGCTWGTVKNALRKLNIQTRRYTLSRAAIRARKLGARAKKCRMGVEPKGKNDA